MIEEFVQEFRRMMRDSRYKERLLVKKFKRKINIIIHWRLMKLEQ